MSQKQLRKLEERRAGKASAPTQDLAEAESGDDPPTAVPPKRHGFAGLLDESEDESEAAEEEAQAVVVAEPPPDVAKTKGKKKKKKGKGKKGLAAEADSEDDEDALLDQLASTVAASSPAGAADTPLQRPVLKMVAADFSAEAERKRLFGDSVAKAPANRKAVRPRGLANHKRLLLVEPTADEAWPRPDGCAEMVAVASGRFDVRTTAAHTRTRKELAASHDGHNIDELHLFLQQRPFSIEGLLAMSDVLASNGQHDSAFSLLRRAVYAVESCFAAGFSPLLESSVGNFRGKPRVAVEFPAGEDPLWPAWPWMTALLMYMAALQRQGLYRSALEVCKLLAAMSLPRDPLHVLAHLDVLCLAAGQYDLMNDICAKLLAQHAPCEAGQQRLDRLLPNFAFSAALASQLACGKLPELDALSHVSIDQIVGREGDDLQPDMLEPKEMSALVHARLLRAILLFPQTLRFLLEELGAKFDQPVKSSPSRLHWDTLFSRRPLLAIKGRSVRCSAQGLLGQAYARHAARFWRGERERSEAMIAWMHACAARLAQLSESSLFDSELAAVQERALNESSGLDQCLAEDYAHFTAAEVGPEWRPPAALVRALNADPRSTQERQDAMAMRAAAASVAMESVRGIRPAGDGSDAEDEESQIQRALRLSAAAESEQRRALVQEQDREFEDSLAADRAAEVQLDSQAPGDAPVEESSEAFARLLDMGFDAARVREALRASGGDTDRALDELMQ